MRLLVVSPDYASHVEPMLEIASEWQRSTGDVVVASGPAVRATVERRGLQWTSLRLGRGSNGGVIRADEQPIGEDDHLRAFFAATRAGAVATLRFQALARRQDLLFEPERVHDDLARIVADTRPDRVLVDHVAFGARLALHALGIDAASIVLGHPSALPAPGELYGLPAVWPAPIRPDDSDLVELAQICAESTAALTADANTILTNLAPDRPALDNLTSLAGHPTIYMYPSALHDRLRPLPARAVSIGSLRHSTDRATTPELPTGAGPIVLVALGTFLSARDDLLRTAISAAHLGDWRLALASGSTPIDALDAPPAGAMVREHLPQVELLEHADVFITHGGNNSVTEACAAGVPMIVLPLSTDQFAAATAIERAQIGIVLDPNTLTARALRSAVARVLEDGTKERIGAIATSIAVDGGPTAAVNAIVNDATAQGHRHVEVA
jgi:MGT family glycosyltransferase